MIQFIKSTQIFSAISEQFKFPLYPQGLDKGEMVPAASEVLGAYWILPIVNGGKYTTVEYQAATTATKPRADAAKVLRLRYPDGRIMEIYILDTDCTSSNANYNTFAYYADGLGGSLPVMPTVTVPLPIIQSGPVTNTPTGTNTFYFTFPSNPNSLDYSIQGIWLNGLVPGATQPTDKDNVTDYATWANSNMSDYGTWAEVNDTTLSLVSTTSDTVPVTKAGMIVALTAVPYCFDVTAFSPPQLVNGLKLGSGAIMPMTPFMLTGDNTTLMNALIQSGYLRNATYGTSVAHKLQINAIQALPKLYNDTSLVLTSTAAVCS